MNQQILDEDLIERDPKKEEKDFRIQIVFAVGLAAFLYLIIWMIFFQNISIDNFVHYTLIEDLFSITHLIMAMAYMNFVVNYGDYKLNVKAGHYILILGSGFFFLGASWSSLAGLIEYFSEGLSLERLWLNNFQHVITLAVILIKFLLIRPFAFLLTKLSQYVPEN